MQQTGCFHLLQPAECDWYFGCAGLTLTLPRCMQVSKSAQYLNTTSARPDGVLTLCEVALGDMVPMRHAVRHAATAVKDEHKHSAWGVGKLLPDPKEEQTLPGEDVVVPSGHVIENKDGIETQLYHNEFIVYK